MARKKSAAGKINTVPKGVSFKHTPAEPYGPLMHEWETEHDCGGQIVMTEGGFPTCNEHSIFECPDCDWKSPSGNFKHTPTPKTYHHVVTDVIKKQKSRKQTAAFIRAFRTEKAKQMKRLAKERAKFPPSLIEGTKKVKGKKVKTWKPNPKFTDAMREHMHTFAVDEEKIAAEIVASGIPRWVPVKKGG